MGKLRDSLVKLKQTIIGEDEDAGSTASVSRKSSKSSLKSQASDQPLSHKEKRKLKKAQKAQEVEEESEEEDDDESEDESFNADALNDSDSEEELGSDDEDEENEGEEEEEEEEEEDIPLSEAELDDDADVIPHQKTTVNNKSALKAALKSIELNKAKLPFHEHNTVIGDAIVLKDIYDDTERELAFYKQGLEAAKVARSKLKKEDIPFSRPVDYFAEMVKSDEHMDKLKQKLIDEKTKEKASQEARKQRELKKFGKKVQHERLQERQKEKRETLERIKSLKKKRNNDEMNADDFDIAIEEATAAAGGKKLEKNAKRKAKDAKYGHGGKKRFKKSNDAESSADLSGFNAKKMKQGAKKRPGKSRRNKK
uniref:ARAD1C20108p n=1 Tax=Blastobotrys adeninivorans TaxID=409370 RepID=A0A060T103_BLAAD